MSNLEDNIAVPLYQQLCESLKKKIISGEYPPGNRIPSEEKLVKLYGVSRITVRNAVECLCEDNILIKKHGKGTYVVDTVHVESTKAGNSFTESCKQIGAIPKTEILSNSLKNVAGNIANVLGIEKGTHAICIKRLRFVNNVPTIFEVDYFKEEYSFLLNKPLDGSIMEVVKAKTDLMASKFEDLFDIAEATSEHSKYLKVPKGMCLLRVFQTVMTENDKIIYCNEQYIRSDIYKYVVKR